MTRAEDFDAEFLRARFTAIGAWLYSECGLEVPADRLRFDVYDNHRGKRSAEGRVYYRGPLLGPSTPPKIKLDLTTDEVVVLPPEIQRVQHPYNDEPTEGIHVRCYAYAEVFAEKTRALLERGRPRDLYDVVNMFRRDDARKVAPNIREVLSAKCKYKGIDLPTLARIKEHEPELRADWAPMLGHQLPALPAFDTYWSELPAFFMWLEDRIEPAAPAAYPLAAGEELLHAPLGRLVSIGLAETPVETVRFAAANRLCIDLDYVDESGERTTRTIEPYSLRRTSEGHVVLHAERTDGAGNRHRTYRVDRIRGARVSDRAFVPRYAIELLAVGPRLDAQSRTAHGA